MLWLRAVYHIDENLDIVYKADGQIDRSRSGNKTVDPRVSILDLDCTEQRRYESISPVLCFTCFLPQTRQPHTVL